MPDPRPAEATNDENETPLVEAGLEVDDPGGAHAKGYTADPPGEPVGSQAAGMPAYSIAPEREERRPAN